MKKRLTIPEAASELGCSIQQVYSHLKAGNLRAYSISVSGRIVPQSLRISASDIERFIEGRILSAESYGEE